MAGDDGDDDGVVGCRQSDCGFGTMSGAGGWYCNDAPMTERMVV